MAVLMLIFLLISVLFMSEIEANQRANHDTLESCRLALSNEFKNDLPRWDATIVKDDAERAVDFEFHAPEVLFHPGDAVLTSRYKDILDEFWPRYLRVIATDRHCGAIDEVRVEGHTSSEWIGAETEDLRYLNNLELSHDRAFSVTKYVSSLMTLDPNKQWVRKRLNATGWSYSHVVTRDGSPRGAEDCARSRRVNFRLLLEDKVSDVFTGKVEESGVRS